MTVNEIPRIAQDVLAAVLMMHTFLWYQEAQNQLSRRPLHAVILTVYGIKTSTENFFFL